MKNVLAIVSSPRKGGNSELLVDEFVKGAQEAGHEVEKLCLREKKIAPCLACEACLRNGGTCVQKDNMAGVLQKLIDADVIVLATPALCGCSEAPQSLTRGKGRFQPKTDAGIAL